MSEKKGVDVNFFLSKQAVGGHFQQREKVITLLRGGVGPKQCLKQCFVIVEGIHPLTNIYIWLALYLKVSCWLFYLSSARIMLRKLNQSFSCLLCPLRIGCSTETSSASIYIKMQLLIYKNSTSTDVFLRTVPCIFLTSIVVSC